MPCATLLLALSLQIPTPPAGLLVPKPAPDQVIARLGTTALRARDLEPYLWDWMSRSIVQEIANVVLIDQEAQRLGVTVPAAAIEALVREREETFAKQLPAGTDVQAAMRDRQVSRSRLYLSARAELLSRRVIEASFRPGDYAKVSTLVVRPASQFTGDVQAALVKADAAYERLKKGEAWATVLKEVVTDEAARRNDGFLGWRPLAAFPEAIRPELAKLPAGGVTRPVQTAYGIQIFRVMTPGGQAKGEDLTELRNQVVGGGREALLARLRQEHKVEIVWP
jgi:hypothetical protein